MSGVHGDAERFDELSVLHAGGASGFARAAIEAEFQVAANSIVEFELAIGDAAHEIDAAAGALVLVARFHVGWAGGRAEAAVDAVEQQLVVECSAGIRVGGLRHGFVFTTEARRSRERMRVGVEVA